MTPDLFTYEPTYPTVPGHKARDTSAAAAEEARPSAARLRDMAYDIVNRSYSRGCTADEAATILGLSVLSIRPRFSELANARLIEDSKTRRKNESGKSAIVWKAIDRQNGGISA